MNIRNWLYGVEIAAGVAKLLRYGISLFDTEPCC